MLSLRRALTVSPPPRVPCPPPPRRLNAFLERVDIGDYVVAGQLEAYSCKLAGSDKAYSAKLQASLEREAEEAATSTSGGGGASSPLLGKSPVGPLSEAHSRKTLVQLILTLNAAHPDFEFSRLRPHDFSKEFRIPVRETVDTLLLEAGRVWKGQHSGKEGTFSDCLWAAIDGAIGVSDCDVYSLELESDAFGDARGLLWTFHYFFYNRKLKRILYFACKARTPADGDAWSDDGTDDAIAYPSPSEGLASPSPGGDDDYAGPFDDMEL